MDITTEHTPRSTSMSSRHEERLTSKQFIHTYREATIRNPHQSSRLLHEAEAQGVKERIDIQVLDVTDSNSIATAAQYILDTYGSVRLLENNAGFAIGENKQLGAAYSSNRPTHLIRMRASTSNKNENQLYYP